MGFVFADLSGRPIADYVEEAKDVVAREVDLPPGTRLEWAGQFTYFERAKERLKIVVPVTLLIVFLLLYMNTRSVTETGIILLAVPFSLVGAVWLLWCLDYNMSIAVWVGLIALAGLDAETGVVMLLYLRLAYERRRKEGTLRNWGDFREAIVEGAARRIRPKLMAVLTKDRKNHCFRSSVTANGRARETGASAWALCRGTAVGVGRGQQSRRLRECGGRAQLD